MKKFLTVFILLSALVCFGCGKNEHEIEMDIDDKYGYAGTWLGQTSPISFFVLNIGRANESESPYRYDMVNVFYYLNVKGTPSENLVTVTWEVLPDVRGAEVFKNREELTLETGLTVGGNGFGMRDTNMKWRQMRLDGKYLVPVSDKANDIKFSREDDYDDFVEEVNDLKKKIYDDFKEEVQSRFPNAKVNLIDNTNLPTKVLK